MQLAAYFKLKTGKCLKNVSEIVWRTRNPSCSELCSAAPCNYQKHRYTKFRDRCEKKNRVLLLTRFSALLFNQRYLRGNYSCLLTGQRIKSSKIESFALRRVVFSVDLNVS